MKAVNKKPIKPWIAGLLVAITLTETGCSAASDVNSVTAAVPAVRINITQDAQQELQSVVASSLYLKKVDISAKALTSSSKLIIERKVLLGLDTGMPTVFKLVKNNEKCMLVNQKTKQVFYLPLTQCMEAK